jgi:hypothetical protein
LIPLSLSTIAAHSVGGDATISLDVQQVAALGGDLRKNCGIDP